MKAKIFKTIPILLLAMLAVDTVGFAQEMSVSVDTESASMAHVKTKCKQKTIKLKVKAFSKNLEMNLQNMSDDIVSQVSDIAPRIISSVTSEINADLSDIGPKIEVEVNGSVSGDSNNYSNDSNWDENNGGKVEKIKTYSKSYPLDGNDKIRLSNQYGKIMVNTWDKREIKVDVQIKAQADDDDDAQKLLDGVQINDGKEGDLVSFKTEIQRGGSRNFWNWGGNNKKHKLEINYTVYMPAKTDLNVEDSYGGIELPDLSGKVKINSSYGSVSAQNLSNASNEIDGSYGSLKVGSMNGCRLDYSYGSADINECNNLKADISYGSFKLGKLTGNGEFDISYVGGFKIDDVANSFRKLNVDASYSSVALGMKSGNNFNFDITTSYGGFNYDDDKVTITSKTPPDGSKHMGPTRNYKGRFGKEGADAQVNIHTSYGGVNLE